MVGFSAKKKFLISVLCAFTFILYAPTACLLSGALREDADYAAAEEYECCSQEEYTDGNHNEGI